MATQKSENERIQEELEDVKRLLVLILLKAGATQDELALALGVDQSVVSRIIPARKVKKFANLN